MQDNKKNEAFEKYQQMNEEDRRWEAQRKIKRMIIMRVLMAALLVWVMIRFPMPVGMVVVLSVVSIMIVVTMLPAIQVLKTDLKDPEDE